MKFKAWQKLRSELTDDDFTKARLGYFFALGWDACSREQDADLHDKRKFWRMQIAERDAENARLRDENDALRLLADGKTDLLRCFRTGMRPRDNTWKKIERAEKALNAPKERRK